MKRIYTFTQFINEASFPIADPGQAGKTFAQILGQTRDVKEVPRGSNKGPEVNQYLKSVGLGPGNFWCQSYVYWALNELAKKLGIPNPSVRTGLVKSHWTKSPSANKITIEQARVNPELIRPGMVFFMWRGTPWNKGGGAGHTGIILSVDPTKKTFTSIEGNTDEKATGEGDKVGVNTRPLSDNALVGFVDWFKNERTPEFESALSGAPVSPSGKIAAGTKPDLPGDKGQITGQFMQPTTGSPDNQTVGFDPKAEDEMAKLDQEEDFSIVASLLKPFRQTGGVVTKGEVKKFLTGKSYSEDYYEKAKKQQAEQTSAAADKTEE